MASCETNRLFVFGQFPNKKIANEIELALILVYYYFHNFYGLFHGVYYPIKY